MFFLKTIEGEETLKSADLIKIAELCVIDTGC